LVDITNAVVLGVILVPTIASLVWVPRYFPAAWRGRPIALIAALSLAGIVFVVTAVLAFFIGCSDGSCN
jgi:hypothetical protein